MGFVPNHNFNAKNLSFIVSRTLACIRIPVYTYECMKLVYASLKHAYAWPRVFVAFSFQK